MAWITNIRRWPAWMIIPKSQLGYIRALRRERTVARGEGVDEVNVASQEDAPHSGPDWGLRGHAAHIWGVVAL